MFTKVRTMHYPDRKCDLVEYVHTSGFRHFHLQSPFPELSFALSLKTPPEDDTGTPHILEHLTLCGSQKYPVKDPFMAMNQRSLAHDLNAATSQLSTCYHFATTIEKDFLNLSDLYSDLVFNPLLRQVDFEQEGWRLEQTEQGPKMKGVVLNEMKGAYSSSSMEAYIAMWNVLAPETPARFSYGGHPSAILGLTYDKVKDFHARHYTPQNAVLSTSGNIPIEKLHAQLEDTIARHLASASKPTNISVSPKGLAPPVLEQEGQTYSVKVCGPDTTTISLSMMHVFDGPKNAEEDLFDQIMTHVLFEQSDSVFKEIAKEEMVSISSSYLFDTLMHLKGQAAIDMDIGNLPKDDIQKQERIKNRVLDAYSRLGQTNVTEEKWTNAVSMFEKSILSNIDESPRGEMAQLAGNILWGFDPLRNASNLPILQKFKKAPPSPSQVEDWVRAHFSTTPKWMRVETSSSIPALWESFENHRVEEMVSEGVVPSNLTKAPIHNEDQLPTLDPNDIVCNFVELDVSTKLRQGHPPHTHATVLAQTGTTAVFYNLKDFTIEEVGMLSIFCQAKKLLGGKTLSSRQFRNLQEETGVTVTYTIAQESNPDRTPVLMFQAGCSSLNNKAPLIPSVFDELCAVPVFEEQDWKNAFHQLHQRFIKSEEKLKNGYSSATSQAPYNTQANLHAHLIGFGMQHEEQLLETFAKHPQAAYKQWQTLFNKISSQPKHIVSVGSEMFAQQAEVLQKQIEETANPVWEHLCQAAPVDLKAPSPSSFVAIPTPQGVNHCIRSMPAPLWGTKEFVAMKLATELLENVLHEEIREKGGAYNSGILSKSGVLSLSSFRDPHVEETFKTWDKLPKFYDEVLKKQDPVALKEAKLSLVKGFLVPKSSSSQAWEKISDLFLNLTNKEREDFIRQAMEMTYEDLKEIAVFFNPPPSLITDRATVPLNHIPLFEQSPQKQAVVALTQS